MKFAITAYVFVLGGIITILVLQYIMFTGLQSLAAMTVTGMLPELQCIHNQLTCALQTITYQCVVTGTTQFISWKLDMLETRHETYCTVRLSRTKRF